MSIISTPRPSTFIHADHPSWCSLTGTDHDGCFTDFAETPVGAVWASQATGDGSPVLVADISGALSMSPGDAMAFVAGITTTLAGISEGPAEAPPLAWDLADAITTMSTQAAVQLLAALAARVAGGAR